MKRLGLLLVISVLAISAVPEADALPIIPTVTAVSNNSSALLKVDDASVFRRPFSLDWTIEGHTLLVYSSQPTDQIGGFHHLHAGGPGLHIDANQIHVNGPLVGFTPLDAQVTYTLLGGDPGSGFSRLLEKVEITIPANVTVHLTGLGASPSTLGNTFATRHGFANAAALAVPDYSGFQVFGQTDLTTPTGSTFMTFTGFNPFDQDVSVTGCTENAPCLITMITELDALRVVVPEPSTMLLIATGPGLLAYKAYRRRRSSA